MKVGSKYRVTHTRAGKYGGLFIHESKGGLTKAQATSYANKLRREILSQVKHIKERYTPYP